MTERMAYLDGLRGVAIALVLLFHAYVRWPELVPFGNAYSGRPWVAYGWLGVQLFFMISGYVIAMTLERCRGMADFLGRRWLRLFPAMAIASAIIFLSAPLFPERPAGAPAWADLLPGLLFIEPGWINWATGEQQNMLEGAFWSLFVEVKFYVIAGTAYFALGRNGMIRVLVGMFALSALARWAPVPMWFRIACTLTDASYFGWFASGALYYVYAQEGRLRDALLAILVGAAAAAVQPGHQMYPGLFAMVVVVVFSAAMLSRTIQRLLSIRLVVWLGFVSYPLYLVHENFLVAGIVKTGRLVPSLPPVLLPLVPAVVVCALAWIIAANLEPSLRRRLRALVYGTMHVRIEDRMKRP